MLNRAVSSPVLTPSRWITWRRTLSRKDTAILLRYVLVVAMLCAIGCLYLWQVNDIKNISDETIWLQKRSGRMEAENVSLMLQLARWQSPAHIDRRGRELGFVPSDEPLHVKLAPAAETQPMAGAEPGVQRLGETAAADTQR